MEQSLRELGAGRRGRRRPREHDEVHVLKPRDLVDLGLEVAERFAQVALDPGPDDRLADLARDDEAHASAVSGARFVRRARKKNDLGADRLDASIEGLPELQAMPKACGFGERVHATLRADRQPVGSGLLLVRGGSQALAALGAAQLDHVASAWRRHARAIAVDPEPTFVVRLKCTLSHERTSL